MIQADTRVAMSNAVMQLCNLRPMVPYTRISTGRSRASCAHALACAATTDYTAPFGNEEAAIATRLAVSACGAVMLWSVAAAGSLRPAGPSGVRMTRPR